MARSNTLLINHPHQYESSSKSKYVNRSEATQAPLPAKHYLYNPFQKTGPSTLPSSSHGAPSRPGVPNRHNSVQTRYMNMLLNLDTIPRMHNIYASFFSWILLAGFVIFPGTFTSISKSLDPKTDTGQEILDRVKHVPLLYVAAFFSGLGALGMLFLWFRWRTNYVWLLNRIFLPGCLNSLAGLIATFVNVYSQQNGKWSVTAWITATVTGGCMLITGCLFALYNFWILEKVKKKHGIDMERATGGHDGEGLAEKIERVAHKPALEPGSVV